LAFFVLMAFDFGVHGLQEKHEDSRCLCKCPKVSAVNGDGLSSEFIGCGSDRSGGIPEEEDLSAAGGGPNALMTGEGPGDRSIYLNASVSPEECDCQHVVLIHLNLTSVDAKSFCPRCQCKFQIRSLTVMKVVVIVVIWIISILVIYMLFLQCLDPILNNKGRGAGVRSGYREQRDEANDLDESFPEATEGGSGGARGGGRDQMSTQMHAVGGDVIHRIGNQQTKWKKQVQEQRRNIYDRHRMLN